MAAAKPSGRLPASLRPLFWDQAFARLRWRRHRDFVIGRILAAGDWAALSWLRRRVGDDCLRQWLLDREGFCLSPRQLRFWELVLDLPRRQVNAWLARPARQVWDKRRHA